MRSNIFEIYAITCLARPLAGGFVVYTIPFKVQLGISCIAGFLDFQAISGLINSVLDVIRINSKKLESCILNFEASYVIQLELVAKTRIPKCMAL